MAADSASHVVVDALVLLFIVGLFLATTRINYLVYVGLFFFTTTNLFSVSSIRRRLGLVAWDKQKLNRITCQPEGIGYLLFGIMKPRVPIPCLLSWKTGKLPESVRHQSNKCFQLTSYHWDFSCALTDNRFTIVRYASVSFLNCISILSVCSIHCRYLILMLSKIYL